MAQEALSSLLHVGCLFAKESRSFGPTAPETEKLHQEIEELCTANSKANEYRDKLVTQLAAKEIKLNKMGVEVGQVKIDWGHRDGRIEELEVELDDLRQEMQRELDAKTEVVASKDEALAAAIKELDALQSELATRDKAIADAKAHAEARDRAIEGVKND